LDFWKSSFYTSASNPYYYDEKGGDGGVAREADWSNVIEQELSLSRFFDKIGYTATQKDLTLSIYFYYVALLADQQCLSHPLFQEKESML
jgi:hypothetical protein